jgi:hypothetical protein
VDFPKLLDSLERFGRSLPALVEGIAEDDSRWKPPDGAWSILEIVCHLADEEESDFRSRLRLTLTDPALSWPPIDPEGWAVDRRYNERKLEDEAQRFVMLRTESLVWLRALDRPAWQRAYHHPQHGPIRAGDLLAAWVAHDCLHVRQIAKRLYQLAARDAGAFSLRYAGEWKA